MDPKHERLERGGGTDKSRIAAGYRKMGSPQEKNDSVTDCDTTSSDAPDQNSGLYSEGEKVLAYHGPHVYEAKVQRAENNSREWKYHVHYRGWNKNWDEWVGADRLLKHTEENILKKQAAGEMHKSKKSGRSTQTKPKSSTDAKMDKEDSKTYVGRGKKPKNESVTEKSNLGTDKPIKLSIPATLRKQLLDDWEFVNRQDSLVKLPRSPNVDEILKRFLEQRAKKDAEIMESVGQVLNGLRSYFDKALPAILLYSSERQQYNEAVKENVSPSTIYGAEHLLRLFVKIPELLAAVTMEELTLDTVQENFIDLVRFLQKNQSTFFLAAYEGCKGPENSGNVRGKTSE